MKKTIFKVWDIVTTVIVVFAIILAILLVGVRLIGLRPLQVLSGSMEPTYHVGSLIYVKKVDYKKLEPGDAITFMINEDTLATHRIVEVVPDKDDPSVIRYRTKGDNNESEDGGLVHYKNVVGKPMFSIPKLGYLANYIQNPPGKYLAISAGAIMLLLVFIPDLFSDDDKENTEKEKRGAGKRVKKKAEPEQDSAN